MFERYSTVARQAIMFARAEAGRSGCEVIDTEHLLLGIVRVDPVIPQPIAAPITLDWVRERATVWHTPKEKLPNSLDLPLSQDATTVLAKAGTLAESHKCAFVRTEHLLLALITTPSSHAAVMLEEAGASLERIEDLVAVLQGNPQQDGIFLSVEDLT